MDKGAVRASRYKPDLVWRITGSVSLLLSLLSWKQRKLICCGHRVQHRVEYDVVRQLAQEMLKKIFVLAAAWHHRWAPKSEPLPTAGSNRVLLLLLDTLFFFLFFPIIIVERSQCFHALYESPIRSTLVNAPSGLLRSHPRLQRRSCVVHVRKRERERAVGVGDGEINVYIVVRQNSTKGRDWLCGCDDRWRRVVVVAQETSVVSR